MTRLHQLLYTLILFTQTSYASVNDRVDNDKQIHDLMFGSWVVSPKDELYTQGNGSISTYHNDGTLEYKQFNDAACTDLVLTLNARWSVTDRKLVIIVSEEDQLAYGLPQTITDIVHEISNNNSILISTEGRPQHRVKSGKCISK